LAVSNRVKEKSIARKGGKHHMRQRDFITSKMSQESAKLTKGGHHMKRTITVTVMCVAMMLMGTHVRADDPQSRCAQIGQKWVDFWNDGDVTKAFDVFTEDIVYEDVPTGLHASGADEFQAFAQGVFDAFPISRFTLGQSACRGQQGFFEWTWIAEDGRVDPSAPGFCGTGKSFTVRGVAVIAIQGKRISHNSDFWDLVTVLSQLLPEGSDCVARLVGLSE
jgi:steroid delta-isomerase-like uncharacterized protein